MHDKSIKIKWIIVDHYPPRIPHEFQSKTGDHTNHESPCLIFDAETKLCEKQDTEDGGVDGVSGDGWEEMHVAAFDGAVIYVAIIFYDGTCEVGWKIGVMEDHRRDRLRWSVCVGGKKM